MFAALFCVTLVVYLPVLRAPLIWDDRQMLNSSVRSASGLIPIWKGSQVDYLPMTSSVFWLEWRLWGLEPAGYRLVNIALHAGSASLLFHILRRFNAPGAGIAACIFCVHPVCVGTVAWIAELKNTLSMFFAMLTLYFFLSRTESKRNYMAALLSFALALLSKISVAMLPFVLLALESWRTLQVRESQEVGGPFEKFIAWLRRLLKEGGALRLAPFFGLSLVFGLVNMWFQQHHAMAFAAAEEHEPLLLRLLGGGRALWFYLWKDFLPLNLMPIYPRWEIHPQALTAWLPSICWLGLLGVCWWMWRRGAKKAVSGFQIWRAAFFGLGFFWLMLLPVLGLAQIAYFFISRVADHLQYLPIAGVIAIAGYGLADPFEGRQTRTGSLVVAITLVGCLAFGSWQRAKLFANPEQLWRDNIAKNPQAALAWSNLGEIANDNGRYEEALSGYQESLRIDPGNMTVRENLGGVLAGLGRLDEAIAEYRIVVARNPGNPRAHSNLGAALARKGLLDEAVPEFKAALQVSPDYPDALKNLGAAYYVAGRYGEAIEQLQRLLQLHPDFPGAEAILVESRKRAAPNNTKP